MVPSTAKPSAVYGIWPSASASGSWNSRTAYRACISADRTKCKPEHQLRSFETASSVGSKVDSRPGQKTSKQGVLQRPRNERIAETKSFAFLVAEPSGLSPAV